MDKDTLIESLLYRCEGRGENYQAFIEEYSCRQDLRDASLSTDDKEALVATRLIALGDALNKFCQVWYPIVDEVEANERAERESLVNAKP